MYFSRRAHCLWLFNMRHFTVILHKGSNYVPQGAIFEKSVIIDAIDLKVTQKWDITAVAEAV